MNRRKGYIQVCIEIEWGFFQSPLTVEPITATCGSGRVIKSFIKDEFRNLMSPAEAIIINKHSSTPNRQLRLRSSLGC